MQDADIRDDQELSDLMNKLTQLSNKVAAAKAEALARRKRKMGEV